MTQKFTAEEVRATAKWCRENSSGIYRKSAIAADMLTAYADTLSKPADSGRVTDEQVSAAMQAYIDESGIEDTRAGEYLPIDDEAMRAAITAALAAQGRGDSGPGFGLTDSDVAALRDAGLKPEEIAGDPVKQQERVSELVQWFARFLSGSANPKWITSHAMELAYYIATNAGNRHIDVSEIRQDGFKSGLNVTPAQRSMLERIGVANPAPPASPAGVPDHVRFAINRCIASQEAFAERIDKVNAGDPYASLMVRNDINYLRAWLAAAPSQPEGSVVCWACQASMTRHEHGEADGFCPKCGAEIELDVDATTQPEDAE